MSTRTFPRTRKTAIDILVKRRERGSKNVNQDLLEDNGICVTSITDREVLNNRDNYLIMESRNISFLLSVAQFMNVFPLLLLL